MPWLKAVEVLVLLAAGVTFCWWQWRDASRAQEQSRRERQAREAHEARQRGEQPMQREQQP